MAIKSAFEQGFRLARLGGDCVALIRPFPEEGSYVQIWREDLAPNWGNGDLLVGLFCDDDEEPRKCCGPVANLETALSLVPAVTGARQVAQIVIDELSAPGQWALKSYKLGERDFAFVEESVSFYESENNVPHGANAVGIVFDWLQSEHDIEPPAWYQHRHPEGPVGDCACTVGG